MIREAAIKIRFPGGLQYTKQTADAKCSLHDPHSVAH